MAGPRVGIIGAGGVGVATASALIMRGLSPRVTIYSRDGGTARGLALDFMHGRPLLQQIEVRGASLDEIDHEDILVITAGHHTTPGESRLDMMHKNIEVMDGVATAVESGRLPGIALVVTNPLDVMTEYLTRRWSDRGVAVMGSGTALETLRLTDAIARECGVHTRSVHAWVVGEHGDSCVFLLDSAVVGTLPLVEFARQRGIDLNRGSAHRDRERGPRRGVPGSRSQGLRGAGHRAHRQRPRARARARSRRAHPGLANESATACAPACRASSVRTGPANRCGRA